MRWTDEGHRKTPCCRDPTSFSSCPSHGCRMKRLSTTRNFCVRQHPQSLCALPFYKPRLPTFSSLLFARVMRFRHLFISRCRLSCSAAQPRRISTQLLPAIRKDHNPFAIAHLFGGIWGASIIFLRWTSYGCPYCENIFRRDYCNTMFTLAAGSAYA